jgi:cytochrome b involved in lipid metabolism
MSKEFSAKEVGEHSTVDKGLYVIIDSNVYEMGSFIDEHPGGAKILKRVGGKDASKQFWKVRKPAPGWVAEYWRRHCLE